VETKDELALGGWGSGVRVVRRVSHPSGLTLRVRSPSPFISSVVSWRAMVSVLHGKLNGDTRLDADLRASRFPDVPETAWEVRWERNLPVPGPSLV
jgi:hypothetical protein